MTEILIEIITLLVFSNKEFDNYNNQHYKRYQITITGINLLAQSEYILCNKSNKIH